MKAGGLIMETSWFLFLLEVSGCCKGSVIGKMAQGGLLMFDWEKSSWCRLEKGIGWKGILTCSSLAGKDEDWVLPLVMKVFVLPYFDFPGEKGWVGVVPCGSWVKGAKTWAETATWNGYLAVTVWNTAFITQAFTDKGETAACQNQILLQGQKMWPQLCCLNLPAMPSFQCQKICPSQSGEHENLVWVHGSSTLQLGWQLWFWPSDTSCVGELEQVSHLCLDL